MTLIPEHSFQNHADDFLDQESPHQVNPRFFSVMTAAMGRKDAYTHFHARRVAAYAERLALRMGLAVKEARQVAMGGMLHDVGKLALSDRLFSSHQPELTQEMWGRVHSHPLIGAAMLKHTFGMGAVYKAVLYHHERLNGSGYPFGLQGEQIPQIAQIVSVADCFDAITTDRPYQKRKSLAKAFYILNHMAGNCLNADLVAMLIDDIREAGVVCLSARSDQEPLLRSAA